MTESTDPAPVLSAAALFGKRLSVRSFRPEDLEDLALDVRGLDPHNLVTVEGEDLARAAAAIFEVVPCDDEPGIVVRVVAISEEDERAGNTPRFMRMVADAVVAVSEHDRASMAS